MRNGRWWAGKKHAVARVLAAAVAVAAAAAVVPRAAVAQEVTVVGEEDAGPIVVGQRREYRKFFLERPRLTLDLVGVYQQSETETGGRRFRATEYFFTEELGAETRGYILHPSFIDLSLAGSFGLSQTFFDTDAGSSESFGTIYTWDTRATFRRDSDTPLTVFSRREQEWIFREFGPAVQSTTTETGAALDIRGTVPTHFDVSHLEATQTGIRASDDFSYTRDGFNWFSSAYPSDNQTLTWNYNYASVEQSGAFDNTYETHDATLSHDLRFGKKRQHSLYSSLNYSSQSGDTEQQRFRWDERLRLRHTDSFETRYDYRYDWFEVNGNQRSQHWGRAGFTHFLYESLTTEGNVGAQRSDSDGGEQSQSTFADLNWTYRKRVPYGFTTANLGVGWTQTESESGAEPTLILDQPAVFTDPLPIVLTGSNVDANSLVITDPSGLLIYRPGIDYDVRTFPDRVEVSRVVGGAIAPGSPVLLDYQLDPQPSHTTENQTLRTGVRYDVEEGLLRGLALYTRYMVSDQQISSESGTPVGTFTENDFTDFIYGAEYEFWNILVGAEHQTYDSTINGFEADRLFGRYSQRIRPETTLSLNTAFTVIEYEEPASQVNLFTASAQIQHDFSTRLRGVATVLYRHEEDDLRGTTEGIEEQLELRWRHRQTEAYMLLRNSNLTTPDQDEAYLFFQLGVRREF